MERSGDVYFGATEVPVDDRVASGRLVQEDGEERYVIDDVQALPPFLTTIASASDLWLFATSNGGVTAGRRSPAGALFPYVTEDKLADAAGVSGPATSLLVRRGERTSLWTPFTGADHLVYRLRRRLSKDVLGTALTFEEENEDLGLAFRATWRTSGRFGLVRACALANRGPSPVVVRVLDGLLDLVPGDADEALQGGMSCLLDAYKQSERVAGTPLALYTLAAQVVDRPEPREALHATAVWIHGLPVAAVHLVAEARGAFVRGRAPPERARVRGRRGAYLAEAEVALAPGAERRWQVVADVGRTQRDVAALVEALRDPAALAAEVEADVARGRARIAALLAATDAFQHGADRRATAHHLANVLFNDLRGGVYAQGGAIPGRDFAAFVQGANRGVAARQAQFLAGLPASEPRDAHAARVAALGDADLARLSAEYLPLWFSRRHGDPSRPWNRFEIRVEDERGEPVLDHQGNWRDIFQNWEALSRSFPAFAEQLVAKFVNASTVDGHNPYRLGRGGIDWEVPDARHPWSTIGYWGDHQIVYLLRLVELSLRHHPERLRAWLEARQFAYADVPYELRPWPEIAADPRRSIRFDAAKDARLRARARELGSDAYLVHEAGGVLHVTLLEKLLVPALAKLAAFVPGGGVWMNTQRPEWNDANNALAGWGLSMVTLCHLDRYLEVLEELVAPLGARGVGLSREVARWLDGTLAALAAHRHLLEGGAPDDVARAALMEALGLAAGAYRAAAYRDGPGGEETVTADRVGELARVARRWLRHTLALARRPDGLFHAYSVLVPRGRGGGFGVEHLGEMLEGQVAALSTRAVDDATALAVLDALAESRLRCRERGSYLLYPDRQLPGFLEKNVVPEAALAAAPALGRLVAAGDERVVLRDARGRLRFHPSFANADALAAALRRIAASGGAVELDEKAVAGILEVYEGVFHHRAFTGRSGTMFAYEGLGSVYWHMVGKLLLAVQERHVEAAEDGAPAEILARLAAHYDAIRAGTGGAERSPAAWGAFPLDPYSHTPAGGGARQPGMTGQVKEEILVRLGELGVVVREGRIAFRPRLLRRSEFLAEASRFEVEGVGGRHVRLELSAGELAFTICQVPVVYRLSGERRLAVTEGGARRELAGDALDAERSADVFHRTGRVELVEVWTAPGP